MERRDLPFQPGREAFKAPGNSGVPNRPISMPGRGPGGGSSQSVGGGGNSSASVPATFDPTRFPNFQRSGNALANNQTIQALAEPPNLRTFLMIRLAASAVGNLAIGFNNIPIDDDSADIVLEPGGVAFFDQTVPQNRVYLRKTGGAGKYSITYANS